MTDKELLEAAARAAGVEIDKDGPWVEGRDEWAHATREEWDPLTDDGYALRLAVTLGIGIRSNGPQHWQNPNRSIALWDYGEKSGRVVVEHGDDTAHSTRRAIVRAAAAMQAQEVVK